MDLIKAVSFIIIMEGNSNLGQWDKRGDNPVKTFTEYLYIETKKKREYVNITDMVEELVKKGGIEDGMVLVSAMHITAGVYVNDAESGLINDFQKWLKYRMLNQYCPKKKESMVKIFRHILQV